MTLIQPLGLPSGTVRVVEYDATWPELYRDEVARLCAACGTLPLALEHVGSTAVPGLAAKPVLDIVAGRPASVATGEYIAAFERAGYVHRGDRGIPGHEFFRRGQPRAYHIHLVEAGSVLWRQYVGFRDHLRTHPESARRYGELKRDLAARFPHDREAYMHAKAGFVERILRQT